MKNDSVRFNEELKYVLAKEKITFCTKFDEIVFTNVNKHAPLKNKLLCGNHASCISKPLKRAQSRRGPISRSIFQKVHRLFLKKLQKKLLQQKNFFNMLNTSFVSENKRSNFFKEAVSTLDIRENYFINISDPIEKAVSKYKFHPSILLINDKISSQDKFSFKPYPI